MENARPHRWLRREEARPPPPAPSRFALWSVDDFEDRIDEIEFGRYPDKAERLFALAHEVPVGFPSRASALLASGEHHLYGRRFDEARECFELAQADGGEGPASPQARLLQLALDEDADDVARDLLEEPAGPLPAGRGGHGAVRLHRRVARGEGVVP